MAASACALAWAGDAGALTPTCEITGCGSNTPVLMGTPIIALHLDGRPDERGVSLRPQLTRASWPAPRGGQRPCQDGARLELRAGRLAGSDQQGPCGDVRGMVFQLEVPGPCESPDHGGCDAVPKIELQVRIEEEGRVDTWELPGPRAVPTYRLVWHQLPTSQAVLQHLEPSVRIGSSICPRRESWMEEWQSVGLRPALTSRARGWVEKTDHLLLLQGEVYRTADAAIDPARTGDRWFQLACAGSSLAKMRLLGFDPMTARGDARQAALERQATLKMLTARYVPAAGSYTFAGVPLMWKHRSGRAFAGEPDSKLWRTGTVESHWGAQGARCLSHRRTWLAGAPAQAATLIRRAMPEHAHAAGHQQQTLRGADGKDDYAGAEERSLQELRGAGLGPCAASDPDAIWTTFPVHHALHPAPRLVKPKPRQPPPHVLPRRVQPSPAPSSPSPPAPVRR